MAISPRADNGVRPLISIVAPCYNESETVDLFLDAIDKVLDNADFDSEIVFIDDGSRDDTRSRLTQLAGRRGDVRKAQCRGQCRRIFKWFVFLFCLFLPLVVLSFCLVSHVSSLLMVGDQSECHPNPLSSARR